MCERLLRMEREEKRKLLRARTVYESKMANVDGMDSDLVVFVVTDRTNIDVYDGPVEHRVVVVSRGGFRRRRKRFDVCARVAHSRLVLELRIVRGKCGWELGSAADHVQLWAQASLVGRFRGA